MTPSKKHYSERLEKDKSVEEILAGMKSCNEKISANVREILKNTAEIGNGDKKNLILEELKKLLEKARKKQGDSDDPQEE